MYVTQPLGRVELDPEFAGVEPALMADRQLVVERLWFFDGEVTEAVYVAGLRLLDQSPLWISRLLIRKPDDEADSFVQEALWMLVDGSWNGDDH